jgi:hypothetical protein
MDGKMTAKRTSGWWRSDETYERIAWAAIFFLGAALLLVEILGILEDVEWYNGWSFFFLGLGTLMVLGAIIRRTLLGRRIEGMGAVCGIILIAIGLHGLLDLILIGPIVLVVSGGLIMVSALLRPRFEGDVDDWDMPN